MKKQLLSIHHFVVSIILMTKGYDKIQHHHSIIGWSILLSGIAVLLYYIYIKRSQKSHANLEIVAHLFESIALFLTTYVYFQEGKTMLPYVTLTAAIGFLVATILHVISHKKHSF
ncbi:MAG: hypothetical protein IT271_15240 [Chitinophagales bacterium]|nr:hypothetical protein [Chitinophagales bacterium]